MRYRITKAEQKIITAKAIELFNKNPKTTIKKLYIQTVTILGLHVTDDPVWFYKEINKYKEKILQENLQQEAIKQQESIKEKEPKSFTKITAYQLLDEIFDYKNTIELKSKEQFEYFKNRLDKIDQEIKLFKGLLQNILGDLEDYEVGDGCFAAIVKEEVKEEVKKQLPKIAVIGPFKNQYNEIVKRVGTEVKLHWLDKEKNLHQNQYKAFDYIFISRHCKHNIYWDAKTAIGNNKVFRIDTGGIETISEKIINVIKEIS